MKRIFFALALSFPAIAQAEPLKLLTEEYPPYNFTSNGAITGASVEQVRLMMKAIDAPFELEILPWARAFARAKNEDSTCVFTTGHDDERDKRFKWIEPLLIDKMVMVRKAGSGIDPLTIEAAKRFTIGTQRDDFSYSFLTANEFPKIDLAADMEATLKKLLNNRIDLMMTSEKTFEAMKAQGKGVEPALVLGGKRYGLACNLSVPDALIGKMQKALEDLIADGTQDRISADYGLRPNR
ncbi:polar amino acid transport system substrate-binding protein [Pararhizobium capsulatum DSM 1112]|uniref:Polar amino acid transport system substrate-binding protein n=1 Tax=Pararhizobium capsulatum DSM 1112 TaxID=1121113 RepID=A0ABU0BSJ9_9HYPH|nr:transporter substrate-binding domain-containing protein [Pararhizobium capsulatum]MDQ0321229.1 polar amino acid transport system substrate-binding protein [Pararhizobium capsulatum DSM 1112]